ncbi:MAG: hypothetical protein Q9160_004508 [Pyrenula sp. 1 TL-2023]
MASDNDPLGKIPNVPVQFIPVKAGDVIQVGPITCRIQEDGSNTDNRIAAGTFYLPPHTAGPAPHFHLMHDETFLVTKGTLQFQVPGKGKIDAAAGDYVVVPPGAPHGFENVSDEPAEFFNTFTPAYYCNLFKILGEYTKGGKLFTKEQGMKAMNQYATHLVEQPDGDSAKSN